MFKQSQRQYFAITLICASLAACGGGGSDTPSGAAAANVSNNSANQAAVATVIPTAPTGKLANSQTAADQLVDFAISQAKVVSTDVKGMSNASSGALPLANGDSNGLQTKSIAAEKALTTLDYSSLCTLYKTQFAAQGISKCSGIISMDLSFTGNNIPAGGYAQIGFGNMSITNVSPAETIGLNGILRMDFLSQSTLQPLNGKVKVTATNLIATSSSDTSPAIPQNFQLTASFANGAVTSYEDPAKLYSVGNLVTSTDANGTIISNASLRSLFNGAHVDTLLSNVKVSDNLAAIKIQTPFTATISGSDNTKAEINLVATGAGNTATGTIKITDASGVKTYNVSRAQ
jgi:hypothetical protein